MNLTNISLAKINRLIAHEIHPKTADRDARAEVKRKLLAFADSEKNTLISRIGLAMSNSTKTFQLEFEDKSKDSVYSYLEKSASVTDDEFINYSISLAHDLAASQFRTTIPGGFCLIGDGQTDKKKHVFFAIKAELQEVFSITRDSLKLIKDVFLSPAREFYKIGFFIENEDGFVPFMYDDQFSLQKKDLTEYFYGGFLGLTTDKNDSLRSKNFFDATRQFIHDNVTNIKDRVGLENALHVLFREDTSGVIAPQEFSDSYLEGGLREKYNSLIKKDYPHSFTKEMSLIQKRIDLERVTIPLAYSLAIVGRSSSFSSDKIDIIDRPNSTDLNWLGPEINNGRIQQMVIIKQVG